MKIEIDTQRDSKEELMHLANMLRALAGSSAARNVVVKQRNIFEDPSPTGGMMNMFGGSPAPAEPQPSQPAQSADLFSLFNSSEGSQTASASQPDLPAEESGEKTSAHELLDDDRIVPY